MQTIHESAQGRIQALDDRLYVADGKLFYCEPRTLDLSKPEAVTRLLDFTVALGIKGTPVHALCGGCDVCQLELSDDGRIMIDAAYACELPDGSRQLAEDWLSRN
ncbi:hypothetical protein [uncultured Alistipes sp.]|jgi:hypothetical protein|uniref:hypothetical protein n=1 Tax=uncultured Alistipes sp. TaxID=538949 RepID=UPI00272CEE66|nr:hypothetical protein [uncultured Alistipes sp.]